MPVPRPFAVLVVAGVVCVGGVGFAGCGGGSGSPESRTPPQPTGPLADDAELLAGRKVYARYCSSCHGIDGSGGPGTAFTGGQLLETMPTPADELAVVRAGRGVMPSFGETLSPEQLDAVIRYTREVLAPRPAPEGT